MTNPQDLPLVSTIAIGLSGAFVFGYLAQKLRLPPLVGYIFAGILIGPYTPGFVADTKIAEQLSEIGVAMLLFGVGLHFSINDFLEVRRIATFGALIRIALFSGVGYALSLWMDWPVSTGILFGLGLAVASTVVMLRSFEERNILQTLSGKISIGWLIVEDIVMVLAIVLIPVFAQVTLASGDESQGMIDIGKEFLIAFAKVTAFAVTMLVAGKRLLPRILASVSRTGSRELFTLAAFSMAMGIAFGAAMLFGVSLALGAFFAGMMIRESELNTEVASRLLPFQDAFAVLFFVAVGMLFDPFILLSEPFKVATIAALIILGKLAVTFLIVLAFRYTHRTAILVAAGLAQIGEFSFILITLGADHGLMPPEARNLLIAGALVSIAVNPFLLNRALRAVREEPVIAEESDPLAVLDREASALTHPVLVIGSGNVGGHIAAMLGDDKKNLILLEANREHVVELRAQGLHALAGDATNPATLEAAGLDKASVVMITLPNPFDVNTVIENIRAVRPEVRIFARTYSHEETELLAGKNVELVVSATEEVARRMVSHLLKKPAADPV